MKTEAVTIDNATYVLAPLNFSQYEESMFDSEGHMLERIKVGAAVAASLENAKSEQNAPFKEIPAGHVIQLLKPVLKISGLESSSEGEVVSPETNP